MLLKRWGRQRAPLKMKRGAPERDVVNLGFNAVELTTESFQSLLTFHRLVGELPLEILHLLLQPNEPHEPAHRCGDHSDGESVPRWQ